MNNSQIKSKLNNWKKLNTLSFVIIITSFVMLLIKVWYDSKIMVSPLLPNYTAIYVNGTYINVYCFALAGFIPALFLRMRRKYDLSTLCIIAFFIVGLLLKGKVRIYEYFYFFV